MTELALQLSYFINLVMYSVDTSELVVEVPELSSTNVFPLIDLLIALYSLGYIYRGVKEPKLGMSWTLSKSKAEWFATRFSDTGYLFKATANKSDILCYTDNRGEKEIIINPKLLRDIKQNAI